MARNWKRSCSLTLSGNSGRTIEAGRSDQLRIAFSVKQWDLQTPNIAKVKVWNPGKQTVSAFLNKEFRRIELRAGYEDNVGVIFDGEIKQSIAGKDNAIDSYLEVYAASGDTGYKARVSTTLAAGHTPQDRIDVALKAMQPFGISMGLVNVDLSRPAYPRGIPLVGMARDVLRSVALSAGAQWSIQNRGRLHLVDQRRSVPGATVKLTASTGLIGWPRQTQDGIEVTSLLNPRLQPHVNIELDPSQIIAAQREIVVTNPSQAQRNINLDSQGFGEGVYNIFCLNRQGDSRGGAEWYDTSLCVGASKQVNPSVAHLGYYTQTQN